MNSLVASIFLLFAVPDPNGWVAIEPRPTSSAFEHAGDEDDPSIWVIFSKQWGDEGFMVRFPEDPQYFYRSSTELEVSASKDEATYRLTVLDASREDFEQRAKTVALQPDILLIESIRSSPNTFEFLYQKEGEWIWEHFRLTPHHCYIFQTKSDGLQGDGHRYFVQSFNI